VSAIHAQRFGFLSRCVLRWCARGFRLALRCSRRIDEPHRWQIFLHESKGKTKESYLTLDTLTMVRVFYERTYFCVLFRFLRVVELFTLIVDAIHARFLFPRVCCTHSFLASYSYHNNYFVYAAPPHGPKTDLNRTGYGVHGGGLFGRSLERVSKMRNGPIMAGLVVGICAICYLPLGTCQSFTCG